jgi:hypothetical protein
MGKKRSLLANRKETCQLCGAKLPAGSEAAHHAICRALSEGNPESLKPFTAKQRRTEIVRRIKALTKNRTPISNAGKRAAEEPVVIDPNQEKFEQMMAQAGRPGSSRRH